MRVLFVAGVLQGAPGCQDGVEQRIGPIAADGGRTDSVPDSSASPHATADSAPGTTSRSPMPASNGEVDSGANSAAPLGPEDSGVRSAADASRPVHVAAPVVFDGGIEVDASFRGDSGRTIERGSDAGGGGSGEGCGTPPDLQALPSCATQPYTFPTITFSHATDIAARRSVPADETAPRATLYATQPEQYVLAVRWETTEGDFIPWACFDHVPGAERVAAHSLPDGGQEVLSVTTDGKLWVRTTTPEIRWPPWRAEPAPRDKSCLTDVGAVDAEDGFNAIFLADSGSIFTRYKLDAQAHGEYGEWIDVGFLDALRLDAGTVSGRKVVFAVTTHGALISSAQVDAAPEAPFAEFQELGPAEPLRFVDVAVVSRRDGRADVFALTGDGTVWTATRDSEGVGEWTLLGLESPSVHIHAIDAAVPFDNSLTVYGVGSDPSAYHIRLRDEGWSPWETVGSP